ncbi:MAG: hypothetical protein CME63_16110 [Halobacteriovoraceae bacterium]|nr:hypothetical protein [Halobacteriovoraceae bacterium]|tara:strand:- start:86844 stop:87749 length:906 start_codon:yes stop_codon:yes gene_type:complete
MLDFSLDSLFPEHGRHEFLENYLGHTPVIQHDHPYLKELSQLPYLSSIDELFQSWPDQVNAYQKGTADEVNSLEVSSSEAQKLYKDQGAGLFFDDPNRFIPELNPYLEQLRTELGLAPFTYSRSLIYLIAAGKGTHAHFDQNINFIFQIKGTKKWWLAPNETVANPLERYTIGHEASPELSSYAERPFPQEFPTEKAIEIELRPGSLLFLPKGVWHKTFAESGSLSLNFTFTPPSWADLLLSLLRSRLIQSPHWRETAHLLGDSEYGPHSEAHFQQLIQELSTDVQSWKADEILEFILKQD